MESTMVIKVKYGEILRRFSVRVHENNKLDLDINGLRAKIFNVFNFSPDTDVTLTYIDEDGDIVTLVNDDDLHDVMRQQLKFLKINVHLRNEKNDQSRDKPDGSSTSTPLTSEHGRHSFRNLSSGISEVLKSLPEPLPEFCSQFLRDFASKAAVTSPVLSELAQSFVQFGNTHLKSDSPSAFVSETGNQNVASGSSMVPLDADSISKEDGFHQEAGLCTGLASKDCKINPGSVTKNIGVDVPASADRNVLPTDNCAATSSRSPDGKMKEAKGKDGNAGKLHEMHVGSLPVSVPAPALSSLHSSPTAYVDGSFNECPFSGVPIPIPMPTVTFLPQVMNRNPASSSSSYPTSVGRMFHKGVICDGCGARPITGPRFKSKVKVNYDLCSICFAEMGNETEYIKIERPATFRRPIMESAVRRHSMAGHHAHAAAKILRNCVKQTRFDSSFVLDVNVLDGTVMAPSTCFTKIWRLRNNGGLIWPRGTQLIWTGGEFFSASGAVEIEVPASGLPLNTEIDVAVDFTAPAFPGQYISYWRLAAPSGQEFGQRVWVLIHVDASLETSHAKNFQTLDLNLPPTGCDGSKGHEDVNLNSTPAIADGVLSPHPRDSSATAEPVKPDRSENEKELQFPIDDALFVGKDPAASGDEDTPASSDCHGVLSCSTKVPSVSYPLIDFSEPIPVAAAAAAATSPPEPPTPKVSPALPSKPENLIEETLLKTLEDMGFKQVDLNKEVLRRTKYNLEQSLDELCGVAGWDPILEELEELGFNDKEMNRMLLMRNNGSMMRVVMELVSGEKS